MDKARLIKLIRRDDLKKVLAVLLDEYESVLPLEVINHLYSLNGQIVNLEGMNLDGSLSSSEFRQIRNDIRAKIILVVNRLSSYTDDMRKNDRQRNSNEQRAASRSSFQTIPSEPAGQRDVWKECTSNRIQSRIKDSDCAWVICWVNGKRVKDIDLIYSDSLSARYDNLVAKDIMDELVKWGSLNENFYRRLKKEPWTMQVRLEEVVFDHEKYKFNIHLSPLKYLFYVSTQARIHEDELQSLRGKYFENAVLGLSKKEYLSLPSPFAVHIAVISTDGKALIRKRTSFTELYPGAWEAGVGEFMHGPMANEFPHFDKDGNPSLIQYLQCAIAEEIGYFGAEEQDFTLYGFALERLTLAPKLLVVYLSQVPMEILIENASGAMDSSPEIRTIDLTPEGIGIAFDEKRYSNWGPTSKLSLALAYCQYCNVHPTSREVDEIFKYV